MMKSLVVRYGLWKSSTISIELTFGKDEKGSAMAAETETEGEDQREKRIDVRPARADPKTIIFGV
jgi:hypothetical protein